MKKLLFIIFSLFAILAQAQSGKIIGGAPPRYINRPTTKLDTTIFATNNATADLTGLDSLLGGRSTVTLIVTKSTGVDANPVLPVITDTLIGTKIKVKLYCETPSENIGMFQSDLGFVESWVGTQFVDKSSILLIYDLQEWTFTPVEDINGWHWSMTQTSGNALDGNGIYSGSDSLRQTNTYAAMAADGSQTFAQGYFPIFPDWSTTQNTYGIFYSPVDYEEIDIIHGLGSNFNYFGVGSVGAYLNAQSKSAATKRARVDIGLGRVRVQSGSNTVNDKYWRLEIDSLKFEIGRNISGTERTYQLLPTSQYPSTTNNTTNILKWTGDGSTAVPSFGLVPNIYNSDGTIQTDENRTINFGTGGAYGYMLLRGGLSHSQMDLNGYNRNNSAAFLFNPYTSSSGDAGNGTANMNMYSRLNGGSGGPRYARSFSEGFRHNTTSGFSMTNYMDVYMSNGRKKAGVYMNMDSIGNVLRAGFLFKSDSLFSGGRLHFGGFLENGYTSGDERTYYANSFWGLQSLLNSSNTRFSWFGADNLDAGTIGTGDKVGFYDFKYRMPNATPSFTLGALQAIGYTGTGSGTTPAFFDPVPFISSGLIGDNTTDGYYKTASSWGNQFYNGGFRIINGALATTSGAMQSSVSDGTNSATSQLFVSSGGIPKYSLSLDYGSLDKTFELESFGFVTEAYYAKVSTNSQAVTTYQIDGQKSIEHITDATINTINLPEIVGNPGLNQVGVGFILHLSVKSATNVTINVAGSDTIVVDGVSGDQTVLNTVGGTGFAKKLVAVGSNSWAIYK